MCSSRWAEPRDRPVTSEASMCRPRIRHLSGHRQATRYRPAAERPPGHAAHPAYCRHRGCASGDNVGSKNYPSEITYSIAAARAPKRLLMDGADNTDSFSNVNCRSRSQTRYRIQRANLGPRRAVCFHPGGCECRHALGGNAFHGTGSSSSATTTSMRKTTLGPRSTADTLKRNQFGGVLGGRS